MKKCWAIERAMAASSQPLVRGPITSRDWFSLRLRGGGMGLHEREGGGERGGIPVEGIEHLYGNED